MPPPRKPKEDVVLQPTTTRIPTAEETQAEVLLQEVVGNIHHGDLRPLHPLMTHAAHHPYYTDMYHDQSVLATISAPSKTTGEPARSRKRSMSALSAISAARAAANTAATTTSYIIDNLEQEISPFLKQRRKRRAWTDVEVENLRAGVAKHGEGNCVQILSDPEFRFDDRTKYDLKDKWRNQVAYRPYSSLPIRRYMLLTPDHQPLLSESGHPHYFYNRWPHQAALKAASRSEFYSDGRSEIDIYIREVPTRDLSLQTNGANFGERYFSNMVHKFRGTRQRKAAVDIPKFRTKEHMWVAKVAFARIEKFQQGRSA